MNPDLKIVAIHDILNERINRVAEEQARIDVIVGPKGDKGEKGNNGKDGKDGKNGLNGKDGQNGEDGKDGEDGVSITDASVDLDGHLTITLSNGDEIDAGDLTLFLQKGEDSTHVVMQGRSGGSSVQTASFTAAAALSENDVCHLDANGEMEAADASEASGS